MEKYICIHGHFYQPPRENPWLEEIEVQDSAYPYRDWNERITAECYSPNTAARILNGGRKIIDIVNNYSRISFNFGPTLLSWMENHTPDVYKAIINADKESMEIFSGHGSAIAQVYNHTIMPLCNTRDKRTQVIWGIEDFKMRFNREPEGMWLAETAVDLESLDILAEAGIKYTILAPRQAAKVKHFEEEEWTNVSDAKIDPKKAYLCRLPSGRTISLLFYDGPISQELAFGNLLKNGENLANRLLETFNHEDEQPQLVHIATDGETYGHHHNHGDMALAYCLHYIKSNNLAKLTNYGEFLEKYPPQDEVQIIENTSWSCVHGVERWQSNCGCNSGRQDWNQEWRAPLRLALDWLRDSLLPLYESEVSNYIRDVWSLRDEYIRIIHDRNPENVEHFFANFGMKELSKDNMVHILKMLEIQRHAMLMYTSCGWFFDEISGIETVQVIQYGARAIQLTKEAGGPDLEPGFIQLLEKIPSNIPNVNNGLKVYENYVKPAVIDFLRVAAHYAVSSLFEEYSEHSKIYSFEVFNEEYERFEAGKQKMVVGRSRMRSQITFEERIVSYAFFHLGDHNLNGGVRESFDLKNYNNMLSEMKEAFEKLNIADIILLFDKHFGTHSYSFWHLFKDESRRVFAKIMGNTLSNIEISFRQIYENHYPIMLAMKETQTPLPKPIATAVEFIINTDLKKILDSPETIDLDKIQNMYNEIQKWSIELDKRTISYSGTKRLNKLMKILKDKPDDLSLINEINISLKVLKDLGIPLDFWEAQNFLFLYFRDKYFQLSNGKKKLDEEIAKQWVEGMDQLQKHLEVSLV